MLVAKRKIREVSFQVKNNLVRTSENVKYLGVMYDSNRRMVGHIKFTQQRCARLTRTLNGLMSNVGGLKGSKRKLLVSAVMTVMLYAAPI